MHILQTLDSLDSKLDAHEIPLDLTICGGAAIHLLGYSNRPTKDIDVICPPLPKFLAPILQDIAEAHQLTDGWLNNGPDALVLDLEPGWADRTEVLYQGRWLIIRVLSRPDLIFTKLYAMCDRREDIQDLLAMSVTQAELDRAGDHVKTRDSNPDWPSWVDICIAEILAQGGPHE